METTLIKKVQKLLALTESSFEAEAKAAMLKAQELMSQNGLTMSQINGVSDDDTDVIEAQLNPGSKRILNWQRWLSGTIAQNFRCQTMYRSYSGEYGRQLILYGMPEDVQVCTEVIKFAFQSARNCWKKFKAQRDRIHGKPASRRITEAIKNDYMVAFAHGVRDAYKKQVEEKAIVLVQNPKIERYTEALNLRSARSYQRTTANDTEATASGYRDGSRIRGGNKLTQSPNLIAAQ